MVASEGKQTISTGGGASVGGSVDTRGGDFIGRDKNIIINFIQLVEQTNKRGESVESGKIETITNEIGPKALDALVEWFTGEQDLDKGILQKLPAQVPPDHIGHQIKEIQAAQRKSAAKGLSIAPQTAYRLGMLAAYRRDYDDALNYFNEAAQADPDYSDAFEAIAWLQQSLAMDCIDKQDYDAAIDRLAQARNAAEKSDPLDVRALALRGYIAKTLAQISDIQGNVSEKEKYYQEAARFFEHIVKQEPKNPSAHNGLGNVYDESGNLDGAIEAYLQAIDLAPHYTAAFHDLAIVYEKKWKQSPNADWCQKALAAWRKAYSLAPNDPTFTADKILRLGQHILWLEKQCR